MAKIPAIGTVQDIIRQLTRGFTKLNFDDNFVCWSDTIEIPANTETRLSNKFRDGTVPTSYLIVDQTGGGSVMRGPTSWTEGYVYLKNYHATNPATLTVKFFK